MQLHFAAHRLSSEPISRSNAVNNTQLDGSRQQLLKAAFGRSVRPAAHPRLSLIAQAKGKAEPPDVPKSEGKRQGGREWFQSILSRFGPVREKASNTTVLDFEKPLVELDNRIKEVSYLDTRQSWEMCYNSQLFTGACSPRFLITLLFKPP